MTGAAACLAGFEGLSVVIHGSSGCYYYPTILLHAQLHGTFIIENEVIFGSEDRLHDVISGLSGHGNRIAVITTCVPSILGEDIRSILAEDEIILVDSPGFSGEVETGYANALSVLAPKIDPETEGVNIEGICLFDLFSRGNQLEITRLLRMANIPTGTVISADKLENIWRASPFTIGTNEDFGSGIGKHLGGTLGFEKIRNTFKRLGDHFENANIDPVLTELEQQEERVVRACDKYLHRYNPPSTAIFAGWSYAVFAAETLSHYLDADICCIGSRTKAGESSYPVVHAAGLSQVSELIRASDPDLVIGSSFERSVCKDKAFTSIIPPVRGRVRLYPTPIAGISGNLSFIENVLNACMDKTD
jgi:nitrogenase molybdenum-iron protein alpha/beta subunit